ncbi:MAG: NADH-quinone oxidoreductase subunit N [Verrucomicrobia bacterium]|nr:NADH-quinone oxidoreductase subunit N [Verrucomicrobiota bacterium]MCF7708358.1 NADH-quinone oxidoreductase subunit N [Verrucomicrobiota bacterium]
MLENILTIGNELGLIILALTVLAIGFLRKHSAAGYLGWSVAVAGLALLSAWLFISPAIDKAAFGGVYQTGPAPVFFKQLFIWAALLITMLSYPGKQSSNVLPYRHISEYLGLMLFSVSGMCLLVSAQELVMLYVSLELITIPVIMLVAFNRNDPRSHEAGMKYVFFSALSSGLLLYGFSWVYGLTGSTLLPEIRDIIDSSPIAVTALVLIMAGVGFKLAAVPFHLWAPDTYEGAPVTITAFLSVASKAAGFVLFYKVVEGFFVDTAVTYITLTGVLATLTMTIGNLVAMHQRNMKRFLAYSSIAQAGYVMIGLSQPELLGKTAVMYYLLVYLFSNLAAFGIVTLVALRSGREDMRDYAGFSITNPKLALVMMLSMFSLAGIPPLAGFMGKFILFAAAAQAGLYWLVFAGTVNAIIALYYYLIVVKWMYIMKPENGKPRIGPITTPAPHAIVLAVTTLAILLVGILPIFLEWAKSCAAGGF